MAAARENVCRAFVLMCLMGALAVSAQPTARDFVPPPGISVANTSSSFFKFPIPPAMVPPVNPNGRIVGVTSATFTALKQQGVSVTLVEVNACGTVPLHVHPRGTELFYVLEGTALVGFVDSVATTPPSQQLRWNILEANEMTVFPRGTLHFTQSIDGKGFRALASFNSESAGTIFAFDALSRVPDSQLRAATGDGASGTIVDAVRAGLGIQGKPVADPACLAALAAGKPFDFLKGANGVPPAV